MFLVRIGNPRWPPEALIGCNIFKFYSEAATQNFINLHRMIVLKVLYKVCVFGADWKSKMAARGSDWLKHFQLLLWNRYTEFHQTSQDDSTQGPLQSLCFWCGSEIQDVCQRLWLADTFSTSPLKLLHRIVLWFYLTKLVKWMILLIQRIVVTFLNLGLMGFFIR